MKIEQANKLINKHENEDIPKISSELEQIKDSVLQNKPIVMTDDTPIGSILFVDSTTILSDSWLKCNGSSLSKVQYPELFEVIGYKHGGSGDNFNLPNLVVENLVVEGINESLDTIDSKVVKSQIGIIKAKQLSKDMQTVAQEVERAKGNFETLKEVVDSKANKSELDAIKDQVISNKPIVVTDDYPIGGFMWFTSTSAPDGWLLCNGQEVNVSDYTDLFNVIGYKFGGEGTCFRVPDLVTRQDFIRSISSTGTVGDRQDDTNKLHNHIIGVGNPVSDGKLFDQWHAVGVGTTGVSADQKYYTAVTKVEGGGESRPKNIALAPYIKAKQRSKDMTTVAQEWTSFKENGGDINGGLTVVGDNTAHRHVGGYNDKKYRIAIDNYGDFSIQKLSSSGDFLFNIIRDARNSDATGDMGFGCSNIYFGGYKVNANGYTKLPNGLILQWGSVTDTIATNTGNNDITITFPVAFTNKTLMPITSFYASYNTGNWSSIEVATNLRSDLTTAEKIVLRYNRKDTSTATSTGVYTINWYAIGH